MVTWNLAGWCMRARQALRRRYVCLLEDELARARGEIELLRDQLTALRAENRAVINSLLGTAGVPAIETPRAFVATPPIRRRSWPQIATAREIEAARAERIARGRPRAEVPGAGSFDGNEVQPTLVHERAR